MRNRALTLAASVTLLLPTIALAQRPVQWLDSSQRSFVAMQALHDSLLRGDSTTIEVARRGDLVIAASTGESADARAAIDRFVAVRNRRYRDAMPDGGFRIVIRIDRRREVGAATEINDGTVMLTGLPDTNAATRTELASHSSSLGNDLIDRYGAMMAASVPALSTWLEDPPPLSLDDTERRNEAMYTLVTSTGVLPRHCVAGDVAACGVALHLQSTTADTGRAFSPFMRADLLYFALDLGGPGAWQRLRNAADSGVAAMLAAAAQTPADSVVARWRRGLLLRRPVATMITTPSALIALTWTAILLLGALGASKWA